MRDPGFHMTFKNLIALLIASAVLATLVGSLTNALIKRRK